MVFRNMYSQKHVFPYAYTMFYTPYWLLITIYIFYFSIPKTIFALLFSLPTSRNSGQGSYSRPFSPLPTTVRALHFYSEKTSALSSLVGSCRIAPTRAARRSQQLSFLFSQINSKSHHGGIRTPGATLLIAAFEGNH